MTEKEIERAERKKSSSGQIERERETVTEKERERAERKKSSSGQIER